MPFEFGTQLFDRRRCNRINRDHEVRIPHADRAALDVAIAAADPIGQRLLFAGQWYPLGIEFRRGKLCPHPAVIEQIQTHARGLRRDGEMLRVTELATGDKTGQTARTIAALTDFGTIGIEDAIPKIHILDRRRVDHQNLITTDAPPPVRQHAALLCAQAQWLFQAIEHDEIVAQSLHLGELKPHDRHIWSMATYFRMIAPQDFSPSKT